MSKFEPQVGEDFPLEGEPLAESRDDHRRRHRERHNHHHGHHHFHGHRMHGRAGLKGIAVLLVIAGFVTLFVTHQLTAAMGFGLVGIGAALLVLNFGVHAVWHWRRHRRIAQQVS